MLSTDEAVILWGRSNQVRPPDCFFGYFRPISGRESLPLTPKNRMSQAATVAQQSTNVAAAGHGRAAGLAVGEDGAATGSRGPI